MSSFNSFFGSLTWVFFYKLRFKRLACFQHKLFVHAYTEQSLNCIANLCSEASPYGNQGVDAKGEYWYSAGLCLVHFNDFKDD